MGAWRRRPPGVSPDGTILFRSYEHDETKQSDYWTVRPDGKGLTQLTHFKQGTIVLSTSYSPDGKWIVHATNGVEGNADVFVMRADGTSNTPVARNTLEAVGQRSGLETRGLLKLRTPSRGRRVETGR